MKKKLISGLVSLAMLLSLLPLSMMASAADTNFQGEGTAESPYLISTAEDLTKLVALTNNANDKTSAASYASKVYQLTQDIDMTGVQFTPISWASSMYTAQGAAFTGTLDGNNHVIKNVTFKTLSTYGSTYGLIGYLGANGTVKNLGVENMTVPAGTASRFCIGGIAGSIGNETTIENCYVRGMTVTAAPSGTDKTTYVGGIAGRTLGNAGLIKNCYTTNLNFTGVTNQNTTAGLLGSSGNTGYKAENCYTLHSKTQGNTSATNSYMGATNCYTSSTIANATVDALGDAFKADSKGKNSGYPLLKWEEEASFEGDGTAEKPYLINDANDLVKLATLTNNANDKTKAAEHAGKVYQLTDDIDMTGIQFTPISWASSMYTAQGAAFTGILDGNNHVIKNVTFKTNSTYGSTYGIIGYLGANGTVKNLGVENMTVPAGTASRFCIGGIAGTLGAATTIENSFVRGMTVTAAPSGSDTTTYVGGISGRTVGNSGLIKNCYTTNLNFDGVTNKNTTAGILGSCGNTGYKAENCYTLHAKTQGNTSATNSYMGTTKCYASGSIADATVENLGDAFKTDSKGNNSGYPLLSWETEKEMFDGEGTEEKPFLIKNASDLTKLAGFTNSKLTAGYYANKYYQLTADIDMTGVQYTPISYATNMSTAQGLAFTGTFDGANHIIKNITFKTVSTYGYTYGLIGYLGANGTVKNLGIENVTVPAGTASRFCIGGIAGSLNAGITIENCYVRGMTVTAAPSGSDTTTYVGGVSGRTLGNTGLIKNCYTTNLNFDGVTNKNTTAGILGSSGNTGYKAENCYTLDAKVQANTSASNSYMGTTNCYASGTIASATAEVMDEAFKADSKGKNSGYPLLSWEAEKVMFEGEGTEEKPFLIKNASDLTKLAGFTNNKVTAEYYANKYYKLTADIDLTGVQYTPISYATNMSATNGMAFTGTLDGNNHIIKNVTFKTVSTYGFTYGLIGYLGANGTVKNLGLENVTVPAGTASRFCIGGIAGSIGNETTIENCYVRGMTVTAAPSGTDTTTYVGGIAGRTLGNSGLIKNCYTTNLNFDGVTNKNTTAGILGSCGNTGYKAENCYTLHAKIQANTSATNSYMGTTNCYTAATITGSTATKLGAAFKMDSKGMNKGYPLLAWETEPEQAVERELVLPDLISDHMLIQQNKPIKLWGTATPEDVISVKLENATEVIAEGQATVMGTGRFDVELPAVTAGGPYTLTFAGKNGIVTVNDVLVGELWVQSGQSNMEREVSGTGSYKDEILPTEANSEIRIFMNKQAISATSPATDLEGAWKIADATSVLSYSAVGYSALVKLNEELDIPVGGICNAIGGASMSQFMGAENGTAGEYYYSKTAPLTQFNVRGIMWYQGEGDRGRTPEDFTATFNKLIRTWRTGWNDSDLPFVYVTLAPSPMKYYASWTGGYIMEDFSSARLGQLQSYYENDNVAIAVSMDCPPNAGEDSLHPNNKKPIGERLALSALDMIYNVIDNGLSPLYKSATVDGDKVIIEFNHAYDGLKTTDNEAPRCFYVSESKDGPYYAAEAEITGKNKVTLTCNEVSEIKYVSYAVEKYMYPYTSADDAVMNTYPEVNLVNSANLPVCPFAYEVSQIRNAKMPKPFEVMSAAISEDGNNVDVEVTLNEAKTEKPVSIYIAFYGDDKRLVSVVSETYTVNAAEGGKINYSVPVNSDAETAKVMIMSPELYPYLQAIPMDLVD